MGKKKSKKRLIIVSSIIVLLVVIVLFGAVFNKGEKAISVTISKVERRTITQTVSAIGKIEAETEVKISSETSGEIIQLPIKEGDTVKAGALLARIKPDIIESQLEQAKSAAEAAKMEIEARKVVRDKALNDYKRALELYKKNFISLSEFDQAKTAYDQAEAGYSIALANYNQSMANLQMVQKSASRTVIYSPINGVVTKLSVEKGEKVVGTAQMQGTEMMRISDLNVMNAVVDVDENDIVLVKIGDSVIVRVDAIPDVSFTGVVVEIGHSAQVSQLGTQDQVVNFSVKIRLLDKDKRFRPGMSCNVEIKTETRYNVLAVPLQAITVRETKLDTTPDLQETTEIVKKEDKSEQKNVEKPKSVVFKKEGNKVKMVPVKTGISDKGYIEILEGLNENDEIVSGSYLAISKELYDGAIIKVDTTSFKEKFKKKS